MAHITRIRAVVAAGAAALCGGAAALVPAAPAAAAIVQVSTAKQLSAALAAARPGQLILLAPGTYRGVFIARRGGVPGGRITLAGSRAAVLVNDDSPGSDRAARGCPKPTAGANPGYGLWLYDAPHWNLTGFTVTDAKKGIVLDRSPYVTIDRVTVHHIKEEAVRFRSSSADGVISRSRISDTGVMTPGAGEAVYIGSPKSAASCHGSTGGMDRSDRVKVLDNEIGPDVRAEHIDIKEGTQGGLVRGNLFDGRGISGRNSADSWVDAKGRNYLFEGNAGRFRSPGTFANGYETHTPVAGYGCGNVWRDNRSDLGGVGRYAIYVSSQARCSGNPNRVYASNTVTNATAGLTNIKVTR